MTICLVVEVKSVRLRVQLGFIVAEPFDSVDVWEGLHAELAVKSSPKGIENLVLFLSAMPYCINVSTWSSSWHN
jgi:hypothetical protein